MSHDVSSYGWIRSRHRTEHIPSSLVGVCPDVREERSPDEGSSAQSNAASEEITWPVFDGGHLLEFAPVGDAAEIALVKIDWARGIRRRKGQGSGTIHVRPNSQP